jgi:protein tyrosine phosphatase (PTP) superfamily phosphohydrolase (DUF442 family)
MRQPELKAITNFLEISDRLGTGGQPTSSQIPALATAGYQIVINLAMPDSRQALADEDALVTQEAMIYVHLPIPWEAPTPTHVSRFFDLMDLYAEDKVFVHCIKNMRVSAMVFVYRVCRLDMPVSVAETDMLRVWRPHGLWRHLIVSTLADCGVAYT